VRWVFVAEGGEPKPSQLELVPTINADFQPETVHSQPAYRWQDGQQENAPIPNPMPTIQACIGGSAPRNF